MGFRLLRRVLQKGFAEICYCKSGGGRRMMSSLLPLLMLPTLSDDSVKLAYKCHSLAKKKETSSLTYKRGNELPSPNEVEFVGSSHGWLAMYNRVSHDFFLSNPITGRNIKLPPLHTLPEPELNSKGGVSRVALSCSPDDGCHCRVMITVGPAKRLAFCSVPGSEWTPIGDLYGEREQCDDETFPMIIRREYEDVVYSDRHQLFFCITRVATELESWNVGDPLSPKLDRSLKHDDLNIDNWYPWPSRWELKGECWQLKYLVPAEEQLFLVVRHINPRVRYNSTAYVFERVFYSKYRGCDYSLPYKTVDFDVYKIEIDDGGKLRHMDTSLDGLAMFVGINHSFSVLASEYPDLKPNTIYFADENRLMRLSRSFLLNYYGGHDNGIFDYETKTFSSCCDHSCPLDINDMEEIERIDPPPLWFRLQKQK